MVNADSLIRDVGNKCWEGIVDDLDKTETDKVEKYFSKRGGGVDYLNKRLAQLLTKNGRVVKFGSVLLHGSPLVTGWTVDPVTSKPCQPVPQ